MRKQSKNLRVRKTFRFFAPSIQVCDMDLFRISLGEERQNLAQSVMLLASVDLSVILVIFTFSFLILSVKL